MDAWSNLSREEKKNREYDKFRFYGRMKKGLQRNAMQPFSISFLNTETYYASAKGTTDTKLLSSRPFLKHTVPSTNA